MKKNLYLQVDGLRGMLAVIIALYHLLIRYQQLYCDALPGHMENLGVYAVCVFFAISGFFMIKTERSKDFHIIKFYLYKFTRLWPTYVFSLLITSVVVTICKLPNHNVSWRNIVLNAFWINGFMDMPYIDGAHWYMTVLLSMILIVGLFKLLKIEYNPVVYCLVIVANLFAQYLHIPYLPTFLGGGYIGLVCLGFALKGLRDYKNRQQIIGWIVLIILSVAFTWKVRGVDSVLGMLLGLLLVEFSVRGFLPILEWKPFVFLGKISFPLYLVHQNVSYAIMYRLGCWCGDYELWHPIVAFIASILLAVMIHSATDSIKRMKLGEM